MTKSNSVLACFHFYFSNRYIMKVNTTTGEDIVRCLCTI